MRALIYTWVVCAGVASASAVHAAPGRAPAAPRADVRAKYKLAVQLAGNGEPEKALAVIDEGLAIAPKDLPLLVLKGTVEMSLYDYAAAFATYQAYLDAGATGANRREAQKIVDNLRAVQSTFLDVAVANGPATIHLDTTTQRAFCAAAPCNKAILPGQYKVIAERPGFERWTGQVTVASGETAKVAITLVEKPSLLTVRVAQPGARIAVDGRPYDTPVPVPAGTHRVVASLRGYATAELPAAAHDGKPVDLEVSLVPLVPIQISPPDARLALDGAPVAPQNGDGEGGIVVPPGGHVLIARAPGFRDGRIEIPAARGADYRIALTLARDQAPPAAPAGGWFSRLSLRRKIALGSGGITVAAGVTGVVLGLSARQLDHDTYERCPSTSEPCPFGAEANALNRRARSRALQANIAFGVAGAAAVAAAVLWFTGASESPITVTPRVGPPGEATGLDLTLRF